MDDGERIDGRSETETIEVFQPCNEKRGATESDDDRNSGKKKKKKTKS